MIVKLGTVNLGIFEALNFYKNGHFKIQCMCIPLLLNDGQYIVAFLCLVALQNLGRNKVDTKGFHFTVHRILRCFTPQTLGKAHVWWAYSIQYDVKVFTGLKYLFM